MPAQTKAVAQPTEGAVLGEGTVLGEGARLQADDRWSPVHMMMFCTVASAFLWAGIFALARMIFS